MAAPAGSGIDTSGWTALVTGASSGIGERFARDLAADGVDLVLTARRGDVLAGLAGELRRFHPDRTITVLPGDLAEPGASERLVAEIAAAGLTVDLLVNNAGFGAHDRVVDTDPERYADLIQVNCSALVDLTTRLLPGMVERRRGGVLNVASTAAFQPVATMAVYAASKAFVLSFTEALWAETRGTGVRVLALCPGGTETGFFAAAGDKDFLTSGRQTPEQVVAEALRAFRGRKGPTVVTGLVNRLGATGYRFVPRAVIARLAGSTVRAR